MSRSVYRPLLLGALVFGAWTAAAAGGGLGGLRWLEGTWKRDTPEGIVYERWRVLSERTFEGESWATAKEGGKPQPMESLVLGDMGGDVFYIPKVAENPYPVAFKLTVLEEGRAVFENPTHDFPTRIGYERTGPESLTAWIEGPGEGGKPQKLEFRFVRDGGSR